VSTPSLLADSIAVTHRFQGPVICPCRRIGKQNIKKTIGPLTLHRRVLGIHLPGCVYSGQESKTYFETRFSLLLTRLVSRSLEIQFGIRHGAGGFSIPDGRGVIIIVDNLKGPGFSRFKDAERALDRILCTKWVWMDGTQPHREHTTAEQIESVQTTLLTLRRGLCEDLSKGIVSANVKDKLGNTLLHVGRSFLTLFNRVFVSAFCPFTDGNIGTGTIVGVSLVHARVHCRHTIQHHTRPHQWWSSNKCYSGQIRYFHN
jgi:hypothetical protein